MFIPHSFTTMLRDYIIITEGVSDTATTVDLGLNVIGRLSANCCEDIITNMIVKLGTKDIIILIMADGDEAGIKGATKLATYLKPCSEYVKILVPLKGGDLREWVKKERSQVKQYFKNTISSTRMEKILR
jgi:DNA primase